MPKTRSHILSRESGSRYSHDVAELLDMFRKFQSVLPASLDWTTIGIPLLENDTIQSVDAQYATSETVVDSQAEDLQPSDAHTSMSPQITDSETETETSQAAVCDTGFVFSPSSSLSPTRKWSSTKAVTNHGI